MYIGHYDKKRKAAEKHYVPTPEFEELVELAKQDPKGFEELRRELCQQVINEAPIETQARLHGMQFKLDMERERSSNSLAACIKFSSMMNESLQELQLAISNPREYLNQQDNAKQHSAEIIELFPKQDR